MNIIFYIIIINRKMTSAHISYINTKQIMNQFLKDSKFISPLRVSNAYILPNLFIIILIVLFYRIECRFVSSKSLGDRPFILENFVLKQNYEQLEEQELKNYTLCISCWAQSLVKIGILSYVLKRWYGRNESWRRNNN